MEEVPINPIVLDRLEGLIAREQLDSFREHLPRAFALLRGRTIWNVNSTAKGGGVAEMLQPTLAYVRGFGIDARWLVTHGDPEFFSITKRIHNRLHASPGDGGPLEEAQRLHYEAVTFSNAEALLARVQPEDIIILHDPQTAGMVPHLASRARCVAWRCHVGYEKPHDLVSQTWSFLLRYLEPAHAFVFSRASYIPAGLVRSRCAVIPPSIDPLSAKNQPMQPEVIRAILVKTGIIEGPPGDAQPVFTREDGTVDQVVRCADTLHLGRAPTRDRRLVVQVSRWDRLKDPLGVMHGFARYVAHDQASLVLAGPNVSAVADDPEGGQILDEVEHAWRELPHEVRKHIHVVCLPMADREENAAIVNALQRHAAIVVQKSLYEGFGLTVTEAMWKSRPVVASAVGGIQDQIIDGQTGLLVHDPTDLAEFASAIKKLLTDDTLARGLAQNARRRVEAQFLFTRHLVQYLDLFEKLLS